MRLGLIIYGNLDTRSGGYLYDRMLVRALIAAGHEVILFSLPWRSYPAHLTDNLAAGFARRIVRARLDILLQDELNHPSLFWLNRILRNQLTCPLISIVHHLRSQEIHPAPLMPLYRSVEHAYLGTLDGCIYNSWTTRATVQALSSQSLSGVVAYPAGDHILPPARAQVVELLHNRATSHGRLRILFVGNVIPRKGLHTLVSALTTLPLTQWELHIVGSLQSDPRYVEQVRSLAAALHAGKNLVWHGSLGDAVLRDQFRDADLLAVPSFEGFGIVYLEAMAFGLPVIASYAGAAHEIVSPGRNGYLVAVDSPRDLAYRLVELADNRVHLAVLGYQARLRYEQHPTWQTSMSDAITWLREANTRYTYR